MKRFITISIFILLSVLAVGQAYKINAALDYIKEKNYDKALTLLDEALKHPDTEDHPAAYSYKAYIYKEKYKSSKSESDRANALNAFYNTITFDSQNEFTEEALKGVKFLSASIYNEGAVMMQKKNYGSALDKFNEYHDVVDKFNLSDVDGSSYFYAGICSYRQGTTDNAISLFERAKERNHSDPVLYYYLAKAHASQGSIQKAISITKEGLNKFPNNKDLTVSLNEYYEKGADIDKSIELLETAASKDPKNIDYLMKLALAYETKAEQGGEEADAYFQKAVDTYQKVINLKPNMLIANYNLGLIYYNRAVNLTKQIEFDIDLERMMKMQEETTSMFKQALPYTRKAYDLDPKRRETIKALQNIYYALNDYEQSNKMKQKLESLD